MKRLLGYISLSMLLVLVFCATAMAAPPLAGGAGSIFIIGEYGPVVYIGSESRFTLGAGYGISDTFTIGGQVQILNDSYPDDWLFGPFASLRLGNFVIAGEGLYSQDESHFFAKLTGMYVFDLDAFTLAVGGGALDDKDWLWFVEADAAWRVQDNLNIYAGLNYLLDDGDFYGWVGLAYAF